MNTGQFGSIPFIQGTPPERSVPLSRYLPPINDGVISTWLQNNSSQGSWLLDPFCASPKIALEAAQVGYRILVTANNPIIRFILETLANPPAVDELKAALAELAASYIGDQRIEPHIRSLYNTTCVRCGQEISAEYFIWEHGNPSPSIRSYSCPNCGDSGEHPCTAQDIEISGQFSTSGLHKARALERVIATTDPDRIHVEQALTVYNPRALYALITLINKIEGLNISPFGQKHLSALLLYAFDQANVMWRPAHLQERRHQLTIPHHYRENNIWLALEEGVKLWSAEALFGSVPVVSVTTWPEVPPSSGGVCIYEGRFVSLVDSLKDLKISSVCTALPRPNQAFWTLSALWAGWLWGRDAVGSFKSVLRRQRYDWAWHTSALSSVFRLLVNFLEPGVPILGLIGEAESGFIGAAMIAAGISGCRLESLAIRAGDEQAQLTWQVDTPREPPKSGAFISQVAVDYAKRFLELSGEPESYLATISAAIMGIIQSWSTLSEVPSGEQKIIDKVPARLNEFSDQAEPTPSLVYTSTYNAAREALSYRFGFLRFNQQDISNVEAVGINPYAQSSLFSLDLVKKAEDEVDAENLDIFPAEGDSIPEKERPARSSDISMSALLWLREPDRVVQAPLTDRYELSLVSYLVDHPGCPLSGIDQAVCDAFPGLFTPPLDFIQLCSDSYAIQESSRVDRWYLRPEDDPIARQSDVERANLSIQQIGERLGYRSEDRSENLSSTHIAWLDNNGVLAYSFFPMISSAIGDIVLRAESLPGRCFIVIPGSRANLLIYKLRCDPRLARAFNPMQGNWRFLKFRHLRSLCDSPILARNNLDQLLNLDPITYSTPQLWLI